ncbi:hypothetical protein ACIBSV_34340 [Embleya sp. NPDC050154]|uniref:hypothetical protein n=1 Tax=unclassified Embleya TaxID=2699296 RepID=UPI0037A92FE3
MTTSTSLDEALGTLAGAIEEILDLLDPTPTPEGERLPARPRPIPDGPDQAVPILHLDPTIDPDALVHALRHALHH